MVKRRTNKRSGRRVAGGSRMYKKCIVAVIRRTKFKTPKMARKAFGKASKICRKKLSEKTTKTGGRKRKGGRKAKGSKRKCKYGRVKGGKRCRKTRVYRR